MGFKKSKQAPTVDPDERVFAIAKCEDKWDKQPDQKVVTGVRKLLAKFSEPDIRDNKDGRGITLGKFDPEAWENAKRDEIDPKKAGSGYLMNRYCVKSSGYLGDIDNEDDARKSKDALTFEKVAAVLDSLDCSYALHTTHSNTEDWPRVRFVIPFSEDIKGKPDAIKARYRNVHEHLNAAFGGKLDARLAPAFMAYLPAVSKKMRKHFRAQIVDSRPLFNPNTVGNASAPRTKSKSGIKLPSSEDDLPAVKLSDFQLDDDLRTLIKRGAGDGDRSKVLMRVYLDLKKAGLSPAQIASVCWNPKHGISDRPQERGFPELCKDIERVLGKVDVEDDDGTDVEPEFDLSRDIECVADMEKHGVAEIEYLIEHLFAKGSSVLFGGAPKGGKSTLSLYLALVLIGAVKLEWNKFALTDKQLRVGYVDYEQSKAVFFRTLKRFNPNTEQYKYLFRAPDKFPKLGADGIKTLRAFIKEYKLDVIFIDTLQRAKPRGYGKGLSASDADASLLEPLHKLAHETGCTIIVLAHTRKGADNGDPISMFAATNALVGSVDDAIVLWPDSDKTNIYRRCLNVSGRHIDPMGLYSIELVGHTFKMHGDVVELLTGKLQKMVAETLRRSPESCMSPADIAKTINNAGDLKTTRNYVFKALGELMEKGLVYRLKHGDYSLVSRAAPVKAKRTPKK